MSPALPAAKVKATPPVDAMDALARQVVRDRCVARWNIQRNTVVTNCFQQQTEATEEVYCPHTGISLRAHSASADLAESASHDERLSGDVTGLPAQHEHRRVSDVPSGRLPSQRKLNL